MSQGTPREHGPRDGSDQLTFDPRTGTEERQMSTTNGIGTATDFDCARVPEQPVPRCPRARGTPAVLGMLRGLILTTASSLTLAAALLPSGTRAASAAELSNGGS